MAEYVCSRCNETVTAHGLDKEDKPVCYECCGKQDRADMIETGKAILYLNDKGRTVSNWPNSLTFHTGAIKKSFHNIARWRYDFWFTGPDKATWHGVQYGDNTQIAHCKRTKG